jgi:hypothetical protein
MSPGNTTVPQALRKLGCEKAVNHTELAACLKSHEDQIVSMTTQGDRYVVALRDPMSVLISAYYHATASASLSQEGLDEYVIEKARGKFQSIAAHHIIHTGMLSNVSKLWLYDQTPLENGRQLREWFHTPAHTFEYIMRAASLVTSKSAMSAMESDHLLQGQSGMNGKVRFGGLFNTSAAVVQSVLKAHGRLLPPSLYEQWYGTETKAKKIRQ